MIVYLIDELDIVAKLLADDQYLHNLRNLLMVSNINSHVRVVATGATGMQTLISAGSPLNNLRKTILTVLNETDCCKLIEAGFKIQSHHQEFIEKLLSESGRHPWILQGLLEHVWVYRYQKMEDVNEQSVSRACQTFLKEQSTFNHWFATFGEDEHSVYRELICAPDQTLPIDELNKRLYSEDALEVLSYHGVIDDNNPDQPQVIGTLFKEWYVKKANSESTGNTSPLESNDSKNDNGSVREIKLFLASSSELSEHRNELDLFLSHKQDSYRTRGYSLKVVRWEYFLDEISKTGSQDRYNKKIKACEIFISLFRTKTGRYTEEEFDVALENFKKTGFPKIFTFFDNADVSADISNKESLESLWAFQNRLKKLKHYFTRYNNIEDLKLRVDDQIERLILLKAFDINNSDKSLD